MRLIEEVAEDMLRSLEELKAQQRGDKVWADRSRRELRQATSRGAPTGVGTRRSLL